MNEQHTAGPWYVRERKGPGYITSEVCYGSDDECITDGVYEPADARLMAAAPDMLKALQELTDLHDDEQPGAMLGRHLRDNARTAIEKATGVKYFGTT